MSVVIRPKPKRGKRRLTRTREDVIAILEAERARQRRRPCEGCGRTIYEGRLCKVCQTED